MRIFHADTDDLDNPLRGGQPVRTFQINRRLAERHQVDVFTATYPGSVRRRQRSNVNYATLGFGVPRFGLSHHLTFLSALGPRLRKSDHDLVVEEFTPPVGFCLLPAWTERPVVSIVQWFFFGDWERRYKLPFQRWMQRIPRRLRYRHFIVQSRRMGEYFEHLVPGAAVQRIPCGIESDSLLRQSSVGRYALFLGRLDVRQKGLDTLLDVWEMLAKSGQQIPLRIAGAGPDEAWLTNRIKQAGLGHLIELVGRVEGDSKAKILRQCRFLVMPSREETFGLTALEAMAVSKPVLAFDIDHLNEVVRPAWGALVPPGDRAAFSAAVAALWNQPLHGLDLGFKAFEAAADYSWDKLAVQQEQMYKDVVKTGSRV